MGIKAGDKKMENNEEFENVSEFDSLEDFKTMFIKSPKVGEQVEFTIKGFKKITDKNELEFTFEKNGKKKTASNALNKVDYGIKLHTTDGATYWINTWGVWGQLQAIAVKLNNKTFSELNIKIDHQFNGMLEEHREDAWKVYVKIDGKFRSLDRKTNDWV